MSLSMFKAAEIRQRMREEPGLMAVAPVPELALELVAHDVPSERVGLLYCLPGKEVALMARENYEGLKRQEEELIKDAEQGRQD